MPRLRRFPESRWVGTRDTMVVYDCDDPDQYEQLEARVDQGDLLRLNLLSSFGPDELAEAANRGFRAV